MNIQFERQWLSAWCRRANKATTDRDDHKAAREVVSYGNALAAESVQPTVQPTPAATAYSDWSSTIIAKAT